MNFSLELEEIETFQNLFKLFYLKKNKPRLTILVPKHSHTQSPIMSECSKTLPLPPVEAPKLQKMCDRSSFLINALQMNIPGGFKEEEIKFTVKDHKVTINCHSVEHKKKFTGSFGMERDYDFNSSKNKIEIQGERVRILFYK